MDALLAEVIDRHDGLERWSSMSTATMSIGGPIWAVKGWPDALTTETVEIDTRTERSVFTPFTEPGLRSDRRGGDCASTFRPPSPHTTSTT